MEAKTGFGSAAAGAARRGRRPERHSPAQLTATWIRRPQGVELKIRAG
jgi:hypothetical protein